MMTRSRLPSTTDVENVSTKGTTAGKAVGKAAKGGVRTRSRRALGDISNVGSSATHAADKGEHRVELAEHKGDDKTSKPTVAPETELAAFDVADQHDPLCVVEYVNEIYDHYFSVETERLPPPNYMNKQADLVPKMRLILLDWVSEVNDKYKLRSETLYLAVNIIDRFLSVQQLRRTKLQCVAVTALLIAAKYVEIFPPQVDELVRVTGKAYTRREILRTEQMILSALGFHLTVPTPYQFLIRFLKAAGADAETAYRSRYYLERATIEYRMLKYIPSQMAASAVYIALRCRGETSADWARSMAEHTRCDEATLRPCVSEMAEIIRGAERDSVQGVRRKYASKRFLFVAHGALPESL